MAMLRVQRTKKSEEMGMLLALTEHKLQARGTRSGRKSKHKESCKDFVNDESDEDTWIWIAHLVGIWHTTHRYLRDTKRCRQGIAMASD